jgi:hypothetical protein
MLVRHFGSIGRSIRSGGAHRSPASRWFARAALLIMMLLPALGGVPGFAVLTVPTQGERVIASGCGPGLEPIPVDGEVLCALPPDPMTADFRSRGLVEPYPPGQEPRVACIGDGVSGPRIQALYVYERSKGNRYAQNAATIQSAIAEMDQIYRESAQLSGGSRRLRIVTNPNCVPLVAVAEAPDGALSSFAGSISAVRDAGYTRSDRNYAMFVDAEVYCGIGTIRGDSSPGPENLNNLGGAYARVDVGCWSAFAMAHEVMHGIGGVQLSAPNSTGAWHCTDERDIMCYSDQGANRPPMRGVCDSGPWATGNYFDCGENDYFDAGPSPSGYLATHWNTADSIFLDTTGDPYPGQMALQPASGPVGSRVTASLTAFQPSAAITLQFDGTNVGSATANASGAATISFEMPRLAGGAYRAVADSAAGTADQSFRITPAMQVKPRRARGGQTVGVQITGFARFEIVTLSLGSRQLLKAKARQDGTLDASVRIPDNAKAGQPTMTATGSSSSRATAKLTIRRVHRSTAGQERTPGDQPRQDAALGDSPSSSRSAAHSAAKEASRRPRSPGSRNAARTPFAAMRSIPSAS